jgi:hypothetical protein
MTISPEEPIYIDRQDSCTKDEAVAKLLGWMRSRIRRFIIQVNEYGVVPADQLATMHSIDGPLLDFLDGQHESARIEYFAAAEGDDATLAEIQEKEAAIPIWLKRMEAALTYFRDIDRELARGKNSLLIVQPATDETEGKRITLESLNLWAQSKYGISTIDEEFTLQTPVQASALPEKNPGAEQALDQLPKQRAQEQAILNAIADLGYDPKLLPLNQSGKRGIKFFVRRALLGNALFSGSTVFEKAWERTQKFGDIAYSKEVSSP